MYIKTDELCVNAVLINQLANVVILSSSNIIQLCNLLRLVSVSFLLLIVIKVSFNIHKQILNLNKYAVAKIETGTFLQPFICQKTLNVFNRKKGKYLLSSRFLTDVNQFSTNTEDLMERRTL